MDKIVGPDAIELLRPLARLLTANGWRLWVRVRTTIAASGAVLRVSHMVHPVHYLAILNIFDGEMRGGDGGGGTVPVLFIRREEYCIPGADLLDRAALARATANAKGHMD